MEPYQRYGQNDAAKLQVFKSITRNFYLHKSFDYQSDLEFLPYIPAESAFHSKETYPTGALSPQQLAYSNGTLSPQQLASPNIMSKSINQTYSNHVSQQINDLLSTPKARLQYLSQNPELSPKRANAGLPGSRKKGPYDMAQQYPKANQRGYVR